MPGNNVAAVKTYKTLKFLDIRDANGYFQKFSEFLTETKVTFSYLYADLEERGEKIIEISDAIDFLIKFKLSASGSIDNRKMFIVGNGGSAGIAMHALADYANAGGFKTLDLYGPALLTCMSNDYGYENVFAKPIEMFAKNNDLLFAISSSGRSPNIIKAVEAAKKIGCYVVTFSGFDADNPLRKMGELNFYTPSNHYGFVELAHQTLTHCILDLFIRNKIYEEEREAIG